MPKHHIKVVELFAGVGGFRIGLEGASDAYETIWNNQWEPSTKHQDASLVYKARFGAKGHSNKDINLVKTEAKRPERTTWHMGVYGQTVEPRRHAHNSTDRRHEEPEYGGKGSEWRIPVLNPSVRGEDLFLTHTVGSSASGRFQHALRCRAWRSAGG